MNHRSCQLTALLGPLILGISLLYAPRGFSTASENVLERYVLVGTIFDQSGGAETKNVAVLAERGEEGKRIALAKGDLLPDGSARVMEIRRNEVVLSDGKKRYSITYGGHAGPSAGLTVPLSSDEDESADDYFSSLEDAAAAFDPSQILPSRLGEYHYEVKDGIYVMVKEPLAAEAGGITAPPAGETAKDDKGERGKKSATLREESPLPFSPFRRAFPDSALDEARQAPFSLGQEGAPGCQENEDCQGGEPLELEQIPDESP